MNGPGGIFYELEPGTAALLIDDDDDGVASVRDANYSVTSGQISVTTDSDLSLLIGPLTASSVTTTTQGSASIVFEKGSELIARGTGYEPGAKVEVWIASTPRLLGFAVVGSSGEYELRTTVPTDLPAGAHTIQSEGLASDGIPKAVSVGISVQAQPDSVALPITGWNTNVVFAVLIIATGVLIGIIRRRVYSTD